VEGAVLLAEDSPVATTGLWGVVGVLVVGLLALLNDWLRRRQAPGKSDGEMPSEHVAADAASREILQWVEQYAITPVRQRLDYALAKADELQAMLDERDEQLAEARSTIRELRQQLAFLDQQLTERQGQITLLLQQLGASHDEREQHRWAEPGAGPGSAARVRPEAGDPESDPGGAAGRPARP
jgi:uncharacterized coiled-coil protein SlyX